MTGPPRLNTATGVRPAVIGGAGVLAALAGASRRMGVLLGRPGAALVPLHRPEVWRVDETP